jgi:hypothetical protein
MRKGLGHLLLLVKMKHFGRQTALRAPVVESDTIYADQCSYQLKVQIGDELQRFSPISVIVKLSTHTQANKITANYHLLFNRGYS